MLFLDLLLIRGFVSNFDFQARTGSHRFRLGKGRSIRRIKSSCTDMRFGF